jgi:hypothetical protein
MPVRFEWPHNNNNEVIINTHHLTSTVRRYRQSMLQLKLLFRLQLLSLALLLR